jgi:hypothetical protein
VKNFERLCVPLDYDYKISPHKKGKTGAKNGYFTHF